MTTNSPCIANLEALVPPGLDFTYEEKYSYPVVVPVDLPYGAFGRTTVPKDSIGPCATPIATAPLPAADSVRTCDSPPEVDPYSGRESQSGQKSR